jgi:hypothetical protein
MSVCLKGTFDFFAQRPILRPLLFAVKNAHDKPVSV